MARAPGGPSILYGHLSSIQSWDGVRLSCSSPSQGGQGGLPFHPQARVLLLGLPHSAPHLPPSPSNPLSSQQLEPPCEQKSVSLSCLHPLTAAVCTWNQVPPSTKPVDFRGSPIITELQAHHRAFAVLSWNARPPQAHLPALPRRPSVPEISVPPASLD